MYIAHELGKSVPEIRSMSLNEFFHWRAYFMKRKEEEPKVPRM